MPKILFRPIRSKRRRALVDVIRDEQAASLKREAIPALTGRFDEVVEDWEHKPNFRARVTVRESGTSVYVFPAGPADAKKIWTLVSVTGAKKHTIVAKNAAALRFRWGGKGSYLPKTKRVGNNVTYGGPGTVTGGKIRYFKQVQHPGFEARNFEDAIADEFRDDFRKICENAIRRAVRAYNRGG